MEEIFRSDKILQFWPSSKQSAQERVYSTTRFILYLSCVLYLIRRDVRILIMGALSLGVLYYMYTNGMIKEPEPVPMAEKFKEDYVDHPFMEGQWFSQHNFYKVPNLDDNSGFIQGAYGGMRVPKCRDDGYFCDVDGPMARGPEQIQRKTYQRL